MKKNKWLITVLSLLILMASACRVPYSNPSTDFRESDLVGTWETRYRKRGFDRLIFRADGTFKQIYKDHIEEDYVFETSWNEWWVERFPDGRVRVHLQGARYYLDGIRVAERDGMRPPLPENCPNCVGEPEPSPHSFHDPIAKESLQMVGELVLNVQNHTSGELLLLHMWSDHDRGFAMIGGEVEEFHRVEAP